MIDGITELAKIFKERDNPSIQGICIGEVISMNPMQISVNPLMLDKSRLKIAKHLLAEYGTDSESVGDHGSHAHTVSDVLQKGEKVIVIPSVDNSTYYIIDKVGDT